VRDGFFFAINLCCFIIP